MAELFGFSITRVKKPADPKQAFTQPQADDGHKPSPLVGTMVNTWIWKVRQRLNKTLSDVIEK